MALCPSEQSEESNIVKKFQILHFVHDDKSRLFTKPSRIFVFIVAVEATRRVVPTKDGFGSGSSGSG